VPLVGQRCSVADRSPGHDGPHTRTDPVQRHRISGRLRRRMARTSLRIGCLTRRLTSRRLLERRPDRAARGREKHGDYALGLPDFISNPLTPTIASSSSTRCPPSRSFAQRKDGKDFYRYAGSREMPAASTSAMRSSMSSTSGLRSGEADRVRAAGALALYEDMSMDVGTAGAVVDSWWWLAVRTDDRPQAGSSRAAFAY